MTFEPIFFEKNRVWRVYTGGKLFKSFFGDDSTDGFYPEEWIASAVEANNKETTCEREGVSRVIGRSEYFDELLNKYPEEMTGAMGKLRILVKILDSAVRLPAQAHPDKDFSRQHFNSEYGKTESWIVLDKRENAKIYFGFRDGVDKEAFNNAIDASETDKTAMEALMEYTEPEIGDVILVPAKTVHAIGAGCLILEVQEPTDFTIQPERWCDNYRLSDEEMYIGLERETAVEVFDFAKSPDAKLVPKVINEKDGVKKEQLIGKENTDCFVINRITLTDGKCVLDINNSYGVYIVTDGEGEITGDGYNKGIKKGDYFFMPACCMGQFTISGNIKIVECY